jgi:hypothetical protein
MLDLLEKLRKEQHVIKAAPWSFAIVCVVALALCFAGFKWYYRGRLADSESLAQHWKSDADYWKDMASHQPKPAGKSPETQTPATSRKKSEIDAETKPSTPTTRSSASQLSQAPARANLRRQNEGTAIGGVVLNAGSIPPASVFSIGQQGGITAGTVNNFGPPPIPTPTVKVCADYPTVPAGQDYESVITLTTSSEFPRPFFALFFDGPVLDGTVERSMGSYGYTHGRADKLPNPERSFIFRTIAMDLGGTPTWFPGDGSLKATVPSKVPVKLIRVMSGGGDDPDAVFNVNLVYSCD